MDTIERVTLKEIVRFKYGSSLTATDRDPSGNRPVFGSNGPVGTHSDSLIDFPTIIVGRKGSAGSVFYAPDGGWPIDTTYYTEIIDIGRVDLRYLFYALKRAQLGSLTITTSIPGLNRESLYRIQIPLPLLEEQKRIAAILDKADAIRRKRHEAQTVADTFLEATFLEIFGSPVRNPRNWAIEPLGNYLDFITSGSRGWAQHYVDQGKRFIRSLDVQMNRISSDEIVYVDPPYGTEADRTRVRPHDVLLTITGSRIGRVAFVPADIEEAYVSQHVAILRLKEGLLDRFVSMFLSLPAGGQLQISQGQYGQTKPGLSLAQIRKFHVPVPPVSVQNQFLHIWDKFQNLERKQRSAVCETEGLFNSLVQRAFRGEL